ncbi:hypothetical protein MNBD_GAMMA09-2038 [hydrothermal vent metagenome]|uniref:Membrane transporter protein n=1 Tax=hydrothermal vent metagenome TaxID=652676 RepID=A0A3B0XPC2_9ZZZZ
MFFDVLQLTPVQLVFSVFIIFIAYTVKGLSGFGSGLIAIPFLALIFPVAFIVPVLGLLSYSGTILQSFHLRRQVCWKDMLPLLPFSFVGISIAVWMLVNVSQSALVFYLGLFVLLYSVYSLLPFPEPHGGRKWAVLAGGMGGFVGALFGTGGPFYVLYLKMRKLDKGAFRATIAMIFLVDGGVRIVGYALNGLYTQKVLWMLLVLFPVLLAGIYVGHHLHIKINETRFNQVISLLLLLSGVMLLYKAGGL